jgi:probable F420-dependent oxidoreductase
MPHGMDVAVALPQLGHAASPQAIKRAAIQAEQLGFSHVWANDHITFPVGQSHPSPYMYDPLLTLATAAAVTEQVGVGGQVTAAYYQPLWLANALASLDSLAEGRLTVAVGVGWSRPEFEALSSDFSTRGRRTDEIIGILRAAWKNEPLQVDGEFCHSPLVQIRPQPAHHIPLWIAGESEAAYRRAMTIGDGFHANGARLALGDVAAVVGRIRAARPEPEFTFSIFTHRWDPLRFDPVEVRAEYDCYRSAGIELVVAAPDRADESSWFDSVERLAELADLKPR